MDLNKDFQVFCELVKDQFTYGGKKYNLGENKREATDILFDIYGKNWLIGTINKYAYRYSTVKREKDLLKIATYMYILWLKRGFWIIPSGVNDPPIDTNLQNKQQNYDKFILAIQKRDYNLNYDENPKGYIEAISNTMVIFNDIPWKTINEDHICLVFICAFREWCEQFKDKAGQDTDTWNETKKEG